MTRNVDRAVTEMNIKIGLPTTRLGWHMHINADTCCVGVDNTPNLGMTGLSTKKLTIVVKILFLPNELIRGNMSKMIVHTLGNIHMHT